MRRAVGFAFGALVLAGAAAPVATPKPLVFVDVPAGVRIPVKFDQRISSQDATSGQTFRFETTKEMDVGSLTLPSGTPGQGVIELAESHRGSRGGRLELSADHLELRDGRAIAVALPEDAGSPVVAGAVVVLGGGDLGGDNIVLDKNETFVVVTASNAPSLLQPSSAPGPSVTGTTKSP